MKTLLEDRAIYLSQEQEALDMFERIDKETVWHSCFINELEAKPIDDAPLFMEQIRSDLEMDKEVSDESIKENMTSLNLGLKVPFQTGYVGYPLGDTAFGTLIQRAGFSNSPVLISLADKSQQKKMPSGLKAEVINRGLNCFTGSCLIMIRSEKVRAVLSENYQPMPFSDLVQILKAGLQAQFTDVYFSSASLDHTIMTTSFVIKDRELNENLRNVFLSSCGEKVFASCKLVSSDVGASGVNLYPCVVCAGTEIIIGSCLSIIHKEGHTIGDFKENVQKVYALFKNAENRLAEMEETAVANPAGCLLRLAKQAGLSKKISINMSDELQEMYGNSCTQVDVFWYLQNIYNKMAPDIPSENRKILLQENIARSCFSDMAAYDLPFVWE